MAAATVETVDMAGLLDECADMLLLCEKDGKRSAIPCVRFQTSATCDVVRHLVEDCTLDRDEATGKLLIPCPGLDPDDVERAVGLLHGVWTIDSLRLEEIESARRGLHGLGCSSMDDALAARTWMLVSTAPLEAVTKHLDTLLRSVPVRDRVLERIVVLCPSWVGFASRVLDHACMTPMDAETAVYLARKLLGFFPAEVLVPSLVKRLQGPSLTAATLLRLFAEHGPYYHPAEVGSVARCMYETFRDRGLTTPGVDVQGMLRTIYLGTGVYDAAPYSASAVHGSVIMFDDPWVSVLLRVEHKRGPARRRIAPWLTVVFDWGAGTVDVHVRLSKMDDAARDARQLQIRVTAFGPNGAVGERWWAMRDINPYHIISTHDDTIVEEACSNLQAVMRDTVVRMRIDLWFGKRSVLIYPFG